MAIGLRKEDYVLSESIFLLTLIQSLSVDPCTGMCK